MARPLRWGIIGPGSIARRFAAGVAHSQRSTVVAAASRSLERAAAFADEIGGDVLALGDYRELLGRADVDAVYIATIHPNHAELCRAAIDAGNPVLCEKPLTMNAADTEAVITHARAAGVFLMEGFMYRCHPLWRRVIELVEGGAVGRPHACEASFGFVRPADVPRPRLTDPALGGSAILDIGCYPVTAARSLAAAAGFASLDPTDLRGLGRLHPEHRTDEQAAATLIWRSATESDPDHAFTAQLTCATNTWLANRVTVSGDRGILDVRHPWFGTGHQGGRGVITITERTGHTESATREEPVETDRWLFGIEADHAAECIAEGLLESPIIPLDDTAATARTLDAWLAAVADSDPGGRSR